MSELIGGVEHRALAIVTYRDEWPIRFHEEKRRILEALGPVAQRIDHIGSTAVVGMAAKPIVDIDVSVADADRDDAYVPRLVEAGYQLRVRETAHRMLRTADLAVHVHVCTAGGDWERRHLLFRDWLRRCHQDRSRYESLKRSLAQRDWPSMNDYADAKAGLIEDILQRAESWAAESGWRLEAQPASSG
ncbi:MAG: GrpB family protein [Candidatus Dormibacteria bacterium]